MQSRDNCIQHVNVNALPLVLHLIILLCQVHVFADRRRLHPGSSCPWDGKAFVHAVLVNVPSQSFLQHYNGVLVILSKDAPIVATAPPCPAPQSKLSFGRLLELWNVPPNILFKPLFHSRGTEQTALRSRRSIMGVRE